MALQVSHAQVWAVAIEDRPGAAAEKLRALAGAGANLDFVVSRRTHEKDGAVLFVSPIRGDAAVKAAQTVGFSVAQGLRGLRVEGFDAPGLAAGVTGALADAGINLRGVSAAAIDGKMVCYLSFDSDADAGKAAEVLTNLE
ncbi:MAG: ACT domain-containing protein [Phycisphaerae bacterium]